MKCFTNKPTPSEKSQDGPPPYGHNSLNVSEEIKPSGSVATVASGPPLISGKQWDYWVDWSRQPHFKDRNPGLFGAWPYDDCLQREYGQFFGAAPSWKKTALLHPGETEHTIHPGKDWTKHWAWAITMLLQSEYDLQTTCRIRILVKDLPARLQDEDEEISWTTANWKSPYDKFDYFKEISKSDSLYVRLLAFSTPEPLAEKPLHSRSWVGEVAVTHKDKEWLENHDFRPRLSHYNVRM